MLKRKFAFSVSSVDYCFQATMRDLSQFADPSRTVIITDEHVYDARKKAFNGWDVLVLKPGEAYKQQRVADAVIEQLIQRGADRSTTLVGVGGGVITDMTGYVASVYMRGIRFGFIPTSLLAMVDASIGGKNGIDVGVYKNMVGAIRQPSFLLYDTDWLKTLPEPEWRNGFAEIIKHACIRDRKLFLQLEQTKIRTFQRDKVFLQQLIVRNAGIKTRVVQQDEFEKGDRKLLNFGHTLGHAIENLYELSHGEAISIGMTYAAHLSELYAGLTERERIRIIQLLERYKLPTYARFNLKKAFEILRKDKKKMDAAMQYVFIHKIGKGVVKPVPLEELSQSLEPLMA